MLSGGVIGTRDDEVQSGPGTLFIAPNPPVGEVNNGSGFDFGMFISGTPDPQTNVTFELVVGVTLGTISVTTLDLGDFTLLSNWAGSPSSQRARFTCASTTTDFSSADLPSFNVTVTGGGTLTLQTNELDGYWPNSDQTAADTGNGSTSLITINPA